MQAFLDELGLPRLETKQLSLLASARASFKDIPLWYAGDVSVLRNPSVSVVGAREVSKEGASRAWRAGKELAGAGVTVVSGLAAGVDTFALEGALSVGGRVAAVIGTPLQKAYPAENAELQETIYTDHLLVSQFKTGSKVYPSNFPARNRTMAALSLGTLIVEASDTSGSLHQAAECTRLGRWLFIARSLVENQKLEWPRKFVASTYPRLVVVDTPQDVIRRVQESCS